MDTTLIITIAVWACIVVALKETIGQMGEIDKAVPMWPIE